MADDPTNLYIRKEADDGWWIIGGELVFQNASFVTVNAEGDLDAERVLTGGDSITITDGGADTTVTVDLDTPGTCTVSSGNAAAAPHTHAVTSSSNPGAAASLLASDASGYVQLTGLGITAAPASNDLHIGTGQGITHADGVGDGQVLVANGTRYIPGDLSDITGGDAQYVTMAASATLANERVLTGGDSITVTDGGAGGNATLDLDTPGTVTVATANAAAAPHTHAVTTSDSPGAAASILASSAAGKLTLVDLALSSLTASTVIYSDASKEIESLANAAGYLENDGAGGLSWAAGVAPAAHDILSASHSDTLAGNVTDGDIIIGNGTPKWSELAISVPAANVRNVLGVDNGETRPSWKTALDGNDPATLTVSAAAASGTSLVFSHRDHVHPITSSSNPGGAASLLASAADGGLQLLRFGVGTDPDTDNAMKVVDDAWIGLGAAAGRLVFDSTPNPDQIEVTTADLYFATSSHGIIHVDGNQDGKVLVANGTRYVPGDLSDITGGDAQYVCMAASGTLANERVLTAGDGIDLTDNGAGNTVVVAVDVTDFLGNGMSETANDLWCYELRESDDGGAALSADANADMTAYGSLAFDTAESITTNAGDLTVAPAGDIILNPTGNDVLPTTNYDISLGSVSKKMLDVHTAEVTAGHIVATTTASGIGGRILVAPTCLFAADLASGTTNSAEKLSNTGFETAGGGGADVFANWTESAGDGTIGQDATVYHGGAKSCKLTSGATSNTLVYQDIAVAEGTQVILGFWTYGDGVNAGRYRVYDNDNGADILAVASTGVTAAAWTKIWYDFEVPVDCTSARVYFYCPAVAAGYAYFDDVTAITGVQITVTDDDMTDVDIAYAEAGGNVEWFEIASAASGAGPYTYWVERNLDAGGANDWYAGDGLHNTGATDEGYVDIYSVDSILGTTTNAASIVGGERISPTYNDIEERWQLSGNQDLTFVGQGDSDTAVGIRWRESDFSGDVTAYITSTWDGGAGDNINAWFYAYKGTGVSAGDAVVTIAARDIDSTSAYLGLESSGQLSLGPTAGPIVNADMTIGITINQDANDDEAFCIKSSDVGHGGYGAGTDVYFAIQKAGAASGGALLRGWKDSDGSAEGAMQIAGYLDENVDTTKGTGGGSIVQVFGLETSGGAIANTVADGNVWSVRTRRGGAYVTIAIIDEDGDLHLDAGGGAGGTISAFAFDDYDDLALLTGLRASIAPDGHEIKRRFAEFAEYARPVLEGAGVVHYNDGPGEDGRAFVSQRGLQYLTIDALRQFWNNTTDELAELRARCERYERALEQLGVNP